MGVGVVLPSPRLPGLGDGHPPPLLLQPGENVTGDSGLSEVRTPLSSVGVGGGDEGDQQEHGAASSWVSLPRQNSSC